MAESSTPAPAALRFRSSLWVPSEYDFLPAARSICDASWKHFVAHKAIRSAVSLGNGTYVVSPNATYVPALPPSHTDQEEILSDGRRGLFEPGYHPQYWNNASGHLPFIYKIPEGPEGRDPAFVTIDCRRRGVPVTFRASNNGSGKGLPIREFVEALQALYRAELERAEGYFLKDHEPPLALKLRPGQVQEVFISLPYNTTVLYEARKNVAVIQRHLLELRGYSARSYLQEAFDAGRFSIPRSEASGKGCWVREGDDKILKRLTWFGVPVWYVSRAATPAPGRILSFAPLDRRLSLDPWDEAEHGPRVHIGKKTKKRLAQEKAEQDDADEDSDFFYPPRSRPCLPLPTPSSSSRAPRTPAPVPSLLPPSLSDEEGWINHPPVSPLPVSPEERILLGRTPSPRAGSPMVISPPRPTRVSPARREESRTPIPSAPVDPDPSSSPTIPIAAQDGTSSWKTVPASPEVPQASEPPAIRPGPSTAPSASINPRPSESQRPPLIERLASRPPEQSLSLIDRIQHASLLSRLQEAELPGRTELEPSPSGALIDRITRPLSERISDERIAGEGEAPPEEQTYSQPPGTVEEDVEVVTLAAPAPPASEGLHVVQLPSGIPLRTRLPITTGEEAIAYLREPFERGSQSPAFRLRDEDDYGPEPFYPPSGQHPVPPPHLLLAAGDEGYLATILWLKARGPCLAGLSAPPQQWATSNSKQWQSRLRGAKPLQVAARSIPTRPLPDDVISPFRNPLPHERENETWELRTFHFRLDFERLAQQMHPGIQAASSSTARGTIWAGIRDRIRRVWGAGTTLYPSTLEPRYFDNEDDLVRLRHWFALGRLMLEWNLRPDLEHDLQVAMGGSVTDAADRIRNVFITLYKRQFNNRDPQVFTPQYPGARAREIDAFFLLSNHLVRLRLTAPSETESPKAIPAARAPRRVSPQSELLATLRMEGREPLPNDEAIRCAMRLKSKVHSKKSQASSTLPEDDALPPSPTPPAQFTYADQVLLMWQFLSESNVDDFIDAFRRAGLHNPDSLRTVIERVQADARRLQHSSLLLEVPVPDVPSSDSDAGLPGSSVA
ncbi:uncharacterized protein C8Q71DRAFT_859404 [Rhodofomes roseus]|uniref:Uncharacterized protein n=1 Tax=Rhodofomes roseus TaxID=34475 RepID=A0ABQ8KBG4_9APHY|nr:uncharacterized protein C8Q71DRAFT_859404 [Rhodofomes roseus]KAH9834400.1 hypothetical protein C8Q71DRAFT_859404 [Rhodofomes roseus]